jgi:hypothetical protein
MRFARARSTRRMASLTSSADGQPDKVAAFKQTLVEQTRASAGGWLGGAWSGPAAEGETHQADAVRAL